TLTGRVLPVGGVREKVLAARRAGITTVLIPRHNAKDLVELPQEVKSTLTFHLVDTLDDVVPHLFAQPVAKGRPRPKAPKPPAPRAKSKPRLLPAQPEATTPQPTRRPRLPSA